MSRLTSSFLYIVHSSFDLRDNVSFVIDYFFICKTNNGKSAFVQHLCSFFIAFSVVQAPFLGGGRGRLSIISNKSFTLSARSMRIRVSRKLGMPLNRGEAAK